MMRTAWLAITLLAMGSIMTAARTESKSDEAAVKAATERFYAALNTMFKGELGPMKEVWSHARDVTYMGPAGGMKVGWDLVLKEWEAQAAMKLGGSVNPEETHMVIGETMAVVQNYEKGENGEGREVSIRATNLFRKEHGTWKMIGHHTDLLSFLTR